MANRIRLTVIAALICGLTTSFVAAQTCRTDIPGSAPNSRYVNHLNGTITDVKSRLMWKQCPEGLSGTDCLTGVLANLTWQQALQRGSDAVFAGHSDWRLPNVAELESLIEQRCRSPAVNLTFLPNQPSAEFWSSSPYPYNATSLESWFVEFVGGGVSWHFQSNMKYVRLVRAGP